MDNLNGYARWLTYPFEKYEFVNWDDDIFPTVSGKKNVPNHQPAYREWSRMVMNG